MHVKLIAILLLFIAFTPTAHAIIYTQVFEYQNSQNSYTATSSSPSTYTSTTTVFENRIEFEVNTTVTSNDASYIQLIPGAPYSLLGIPTLNVEYEFDEITNGNCAMALSSTPTGSNLSTQLLTNDQARTTVSMNSWSSNSNYFRLYKSSATLCHGKLIVYGITSSTTDKYPLSFSVIPQPSEINVIEAVLEFPDSVNFQTDSINYALGFMIMLMAIQTWFVMIRRSK